MLRVSPKVLWSVVFFGGVIGVNLLLSSGEDAADAPQIARLGLMEQELEALERQIHSLEENLRAHEDEIEQRITKIEACKDKLKGYESQAVDGALPSGLFREYEQARGTCNELVDAHNEAVDSLKPFITEYELKVSLYNLQVHEYNSLASRPSRSTIIVPTRRWRRR